MKKCKQNESYFEFHFVVVGKVAADAPLAAALLWVASLMEMSLDMAGSCLDSILIVQAVNVTENFLTWKAQSELVKEKLHCTKAAKFLSLKQSWKCVKYCTSSKKNKKNSPILLQELKFLCWCDQNKHKAQTDMQTHKSRLCFILILSFSLNSSCFHVWVLKKRNRKCSNWRLKSQWRRRKQNLFVGFVVLNMLNLYSDLILLGTSSRIISDVTTC